MDLDLHIIHGGIRMQLPTYSLYCVCRFNRRHDMRRPTIVGYRRGERSIENYIFVRSVTFSIKHALTMTPAHAHDDFWIFRSRQEAEEDKDTRLQKRR